MLYFLPTYTSAYILDIASKEHQGRVLGIKSTAGSLGNILGPALVALFTGILTAQGIFMAAMSSVLLATLAFLFIRERQPSWSDRMIGIQPGGQQPSG